MAEDFLMALRFHYYVKGRSLVPDAHYDRAEKEFMAREPTNEFSTPIGEVGSSIKESYSDRVMALALYLSFVDDFKLKQFREEKKQSQNG